MHLSPATTIVILDRCYRGSRFTLDISAHGLPIETFNNDRSAFLLLLILYPALSIRGRETVLGYSGLHPLLEMATTRATGKQ